MPRPRQAAQSGPSPTRRRPSRRRGQSRAGGGRRRGRRSQHRRPARSQPRDIRTARRSPTAPPGQDDQASGRAPVGQHCDCERSERVSDLSAAGTAVGLTFGVAVSPIVAALVTPSLRQPTRRPTGRPASRARNHRGVRPDRPTGRVAVAASRLPDLLRRARRPRPMRPLLAGPAQAGRLPDMGGRARRARPPLVLSRRRRRWRCSPVCHLRRAAPCGPDAMAFGDARIAGPVGTALGWWGGTTVIIGLTPGFVAAGTASLILIAAGRLERRGSLPLGTYLGAGTAIVVWVWP